MDNRDPKKNPPKQYVEPGTKEPKSIPAEKQDSDKVHDNPGSQNTG